MGLGLLVGEFRGLLVVMVMIMMMTMMMLKAAVLMNVVLLAVEMVVVKAMAALLAYSSPSLILNMPGTFRERRPGADKTYIAMRMVYWTTCCP